MATSLDPSSFDWADPASVREFAARCDGWAVSHRRRGGLEDLRKASGYEKAAAEAREWADDLEGKAA